MKLHLESTRASAARKFLTAFLAVQLIAINFSPAWAAGHDLPQPNDLDASKYSTSGNTMTITPGGQGTINYDWFDIGHDFTVTFENAGEVTINKVNGGGQSEIFGNLNASGIIYLLNKSGVLFGDHAHVNVGGLVASTFMDISKNADGQLEFTGDPGTGDITVEGGATINAGAFAYLVGKNVNLAGAVNAGEVIVAAFGDKKDDYDAGSIVLRLGEDNPNTDGGDIAITNKFFTTNSVSELNGDVTITNIVFYAEKEIGRAHV